MDKNLWELIKRYRKDVFGIPEMVTDLVSVKDILKKSVSGYSNLRISYSVNSNIKYISNILKEFLDFDGWENDLDINPLAIYNRSSGNYLRFYQDIISVSSMMDELLIKISFNLCKNYKEICEVINKYDR